MLLGAMLCYPGFMALCLAMDRHYQALRARTLGKPLQLALRLSGVLLLGSAMLSLVIGAGWALGLVRSLGLAMASAGLLVWLLPYHPKLALRLAVLAIPGALFLGLYQALAS